MSASSVPPLSIDRLPATLQHLQQASRAPLTDATNLISTLSALTALLALSPSASSTCRQSGALLPSLSSILAAACQSAAAAAGGEAEAVRVALLQSVLLTLTGWLSNDAVGSAAFVSSVGLPAIFSPLLSLPPASLSADSWAAVCEGLVWLAVHHLPSPLPAPSPSSLPGTAASPSLPLRPHLLVCEPSAVHSLLLLLPRTPAAFQRTALFWLLALDRADSRNAALLCSTPPSSPASQSSLACLLSSYRPLLTSAPSSLSEDDLHVRDAVWRVTSRLLPASSERRDVRAVMSLVSSPSAALLPPLLDAVQEAQRRTERWPWVDVIGECAEGQQATGGWLEVTASSGGKDKARIFPPERGYSVALWLYVDEHTAHVKQAAASTSSSAASLSPPLFPSPPSSFSSHRPPYLPLITLLQQDKLRALFFLSASSHLTAVVAPTPSALRSSSPVAACFSSFPFHTHTWYQLTLLHTSSSPASLTLYVDGDYVQSLPLPYPQQSDRLLFGCWEGAVGGRLSKEAVRVGDVRVQARLGSVLVSDLVLNDRQCQELYTSAAVHQPPAIETAASEENKQATANGSSAEEDWGTIARGCKSQWLAAALSHEGEVTADSSSSTSSSQPAPVAGLPLPVPLQHIMLHLHPSFTSLTTTTASPNAPPTSQPVFNNHVGRFTPSPLLSDAVLHGSVYSHMPHSFISSYAEHGGLSHLLLLLSECSDSAALLALLQLLLFLLSSSASVGASFQSSTGLSIISSLLHDKPSLITPAILSVLYSLCGLSFDGQRGTIAYPSAFSLIFSHTLFLLPLPLALRVRLYQPLIAALLNNKQRAANVQAFREQGLVPFLLSLLSARLVPLGSEAAAAADGADGMSGDEDVSEQLKGVLFLLFAEDLQEKEMREVCHFLLSDNERVVAATSFSASNVRGEAKVDEALSGWHYDMAVKNSMLDLLLGVLLNSTLPAALLSPTASMPPSAVTSPPPGKGKSAAKAASSSSPTAAAAPNAPSAATNSAQTSQSSNEALFTSLLQPSFLLALLSHIQSSYDRIRALVVQSHASSAESALARIDVNLPLRSVLYTLKLLTTLTLRYPAYLQAMNQEMVWLALRDVLASPPVKELLVTDGVTSTTSSVSPFSGLVSGSSNVWGLAACLLLGREVDGHVSELPATRGSSPVRALLNESGELANALLSVYGQCKADPRYRLHLHARDVLPLLLSMASTDSRFLHTTAPTSTPPSSSVLLRHLADFVAVLVRDCEEARQYATHGNGAFMEQFAIASLAHEQAAVGELAAPPAAADEVEAASIGRGVNGVSLEKADTKAANSVAATSSDEREEHVKAVNGIIHDEEDKADHNSVAPADVEKQQVEPIAQHRPADEQSANQAPLSAPSEAADRFEIARDDQTNEMNAAETSDAEQPPTLESQHSEQPQLDGFNATKQQAETDPAALSDAQHDASDQPSDVTVEPQSGEQALLSPAKKELPSTTTESDAHSHVDEPSSYGHDHLDRPITPPPQLGSPLLSPSDHSPLSSLAISDMNDSRASVADDEMSYSSSGHDGHAGHRRGGTMGSLAEELMEADEEEQQEEELEAQRRYEEYQREERRLALLEAEKQQEEVRQLQRDREEAERRARIAEEARQRQRDDEARRAKEEEEERQRLQRLEEEAEAEVAAEAALEEEEERKKQQAELEQRRAAELEKQRKLAAAVEEKRRFELEVQESASPIPFDNPTSQAVFAFLSQLLLLSLASPRPYVDSGVNAELPVLHTRLDTGVEEYIVKTPHPSSTSDGRSYAFSLLFDMLHFPVPPRLAAVLAASVAAVHTQYRSLLLKEVARQLLSSTDKFASLVLSSSTFAHNFAQLLFICLNELRCGEWRGDGPQLLLNVLGGWLRTPRFLSLLSAASAPPSQGKKVPDDGRRSAKVALAVVHSALLVKYAQALGLLARFVHPPSSATASSLSRRGKREPKLLEWCNEYVAQHKEPVLSVLMTKEKQHAMVACLLYCLFVQLSEEDERVCRTAATALSALMSSSAKSIPYVTSLLSGKQPFTSSASFLPFPPHQLPVLSIGLSLLQRGDVQNFALWRRDSYAALAASLRATLGVSMEQWKAAREQQIQRHSKERDDERRRRDEDWRRRVAKEEQERAEVAVRVRMLESSVKERRVKAEQDKKKEERKASSVNVRMQRKKLEMKRKEEEMREKREEELEKRKGSRGVTAQQWAAVANATQVDDSAEWRLKVPQLYSNQQQQQSQQARV